MNNYKKDSALEACKLISKGQIIGLGAGSTIAFLVEAIAADQALAASLMFTSPSFDTIQLLNGYGLTVRSAGSLEKIDLYFDGCDQMDQQLNALKSGGGIHTYEKILAAMADQFILLGDTGKMVEKLDATYPLVVEVMPQALSSVSLLLKDRFEGVSLQMRTGDLRVGPVLTEGGNYLIDLRFNKLPQLELLNQVKMIPGVVDHSLFYQMASKAIIAGPEGVRVCSIKS